MGNKVLNSLVGRGRTLTQKVSLDDSNSSGVKVRMGLLKVFLAKWWDGTRCHVALSTQLKWLALRSYWKSPSKIGLIPGVSPT